MVGRSRSLFGWGFLDRDGHGLLSDALCYHLGAFCTCFRIQPVFVGHAHLGRLELGAMFAFGEIIWGAGHCLGITDSWSLHELLV